MDAVLPHEARFPNTHAEQMGVWLAARAHYTAETEKWKASAESARDRVTERSLELQQYAAETERLREALGELVESLKPIHVARRYYDALKAAKALLSDHSTTEEG
jgi:hypothetical protein